MAVRTSRCYALMVGTATLLMALFVGTPCLASPPGWSVRQLTVDPMAHFSPMTSGDRVVWTRGNGNDNQICTWTPSSGTRVLTSGDRDRMFPVVSGDRVAWQARDDEGHVQIYTWHAGDIAPTQVTNIYPFLYFAFLHPDISGDRIVWQSATWKAGDSEVTPLPGNGMYPRVSGNRIVWQGSDQQIQIYTWKVGDPASTALTNDGLTNSSPQVSGDRVVWMGGPYDSQQVFTWKAGDATPTQLTSDPHNHDAVHVSGDRIVWQGFDGFVAQIFTWKAGDLAATRLTNDLHEHRESSLSGDRVSWVGYDGSNYQIFTANPLPKATVYTPVAPSTMYRGRSATIYGYVAPRHTSGTYLATLKFYLRNSHGVYVFHNSVNAKRYYYSTAKSKYSARVSLPHAGRWRVRAMHSDAGHSTSYSGYDYITVK